MSEGFYATIFYARATPNIAARTTTSVFAFVPRAALELVAAGALVEEPLLEVLVAPPDAGAVAVGTPKPEMLPVRGPGIVEADAPSPTRKPTDCCLTRTSGLVNEKSQAQHLLLGCH